MKLDRKTEVSNEVLRYELITHKEDILKNSILIKPSNDDQI